jgi:hypothetical protein
MKNLCSPLSVTDLLEKLVQGGSRSENKRGCRTSPTGSCVCEGYSHGKTIVTPSARLRSRRLISRKNRVPRSILKDEPSTVCHAAGFTRDDIVQLCGCAHAVNEATAEPEKITWR